MPERLYDTHGRKLLAELCVSGHGIEIGCNAKKISPQNSLGLDIDPSVNPDIIADMNDPQAIGTGWAGWDFLIASHVLEHTYDTIGTLITWVGALKQGGKLGVITPHGEYAPWQSLGDASGTHRQLFTPKTLELFLKHVGLIDVVTLVYDRPNAWKQTPGIFGRGTRP